MRAPIPPGGRMVVKVGSSSLVGGDGRLDDGAVERTVTEVADSWVAGHPTVLVTSGAVAAGLSALGTTERPTDMAGLQVAGAVGQGRLMHRYARAFDRRGLVSGQVLLTRGVLADRNQYLNARRALDRMLEERIVPIVNENDTVVADEVRLGDNDRLAAIVSHLVGAAVLVILTDTEGLFAADPRLGDTEFLHAVDHADERLDRLTGSGPLGTGGVASKVAAARMAAWSRIPTVIAAAHSPLAPVRNGDPIGTWVEPRPSPLPARKLWIAFGQPVSGSMAVDEGAEAALVAGGTSLLPVGVVEVTGAFEAGDTVDVGSHDGRVVARGLAKMDAARVRSLIGQRGADEAIHRDDLVVFGG